MNNIFANEKGVVGGAIIAGITATFAAVTIVGTAWAIAIGVTVAIGSYLMSDGAADYADSPSYGGGGGHISNTGCEGRPIPVCYGKVKAGGNKVRYNHQDADNQNLIVSHCRGEISGVTKTFVNNIEWSELESDVHEKTHYVGNRTQTYYEKTTNSGTAFDGRESAYRGIAYTVFSFKKDDPEIGWDPAVTFEITGKLCTPIGGGAKTATRNNAVILTDWYDNVEKLEAAVLPYDGLTEIVGSPNHNNCMFVFSGYLYSGGSTNINRSADGTNWTEVLSSGPTGAMNFKCFAEMDGYLYACYSSGEIWRTANGTDWVLIHTCPAEITAIILYDSMLYIAAKNHMIYKSVDGISWIGAGNLGDIPYCLGVFNNVLYAGGDSLYKTTTGITWDYITDLGTIICLTVADGYMYAGCGDIIYTETTGERIYKTSDGTGWTNVHIVPGQSSLINDITEFGGSLYACSALGNFLQSSDGSSWGIIDSGLWGDMYFCTVTFGDTLYYGSMPNGVFTAAFLDDPLDRNGFKSLEAFCDEIPTGSTLPRYRFDFIFDTDITINDAKKTMFKAFNGQIIQSQGKLKPVWDARVMPDGSGGLTAKTVSYAFTEDNILNGSITWNQPERPNAIRIFYIDSDKDFTKTSCELRDEEDIEINGEILFEESCWWITEGEIARRRCQYRYDKFLHTDYETKFSALSSSSGLELFDLVTVTHTLPGWSAKKFIVTGKNETEYGIMGFNLEAYYEGIYSDTMATGQENFAVDQPGVSVGDLICLKSYADANLSGIPKVIRLVHLPYGKGIRLKVYPTISAQADLLGYGFGTDIAAYADHDILDPASAIIVEYSVDGERYFSKGYGEATGYIDTTAPVNMGVLPSYTEIRQDCDIYGQARIGVLPISGVDYYFKIYPKRRAV